MFIVCIRKHHILGYIAQAFIVKDYKTKYYRIQHSVNKQDVDENFSDYTSDERNIINLINQYSDINLVKAFSRNKKNSVPDFYANIAQTLVEQRIRPYIERRLLKMLEIFKNAKIKVFLKHDRYENIYFGDEINILQKPAQAIFNFIRTDKEIQYFLTVKHVQKEIKLSKRVEIVLTNEPCNIILDNDLYFFNDIDAKKLSPFFKKEYISVSKRMEEKYFKVFVSKAIQNFRVNATGFEINRKTPKKQVLLMLEKDWKNEYSFTPKFQYGDIAYLHTSKNLKNINYNKIDNKISFNIFERDLVWEKNHLTFLLEIGLKNADENTYNIKNTSKINEFQHAKTITWLNDNSEKLTNKGFIIVQQFADKKYFTQKVTIDFNLKKRIDWFDIYGTVKFGEYEIPFIRLKDNILNGISEVELPNGEIGIIPEEWFLEYKNIFLLGETNNDGLKLNKYHFFALSKTHIKKIKKTEIKQLLDFFNNKNHKLLVTPWTVRANLRDYQKKGFAWLNALQENNFGGCLADDMGLGKTLQTLTVIANSIEKTANLETENQQLTFFDTGNKIVSKSELTNIIISPKSLIYNWHNEIKKFIPSLRVARYTGSERMKLRPDLIKYDIILTSYGIARNDYEFLSEINFHYIVLDESQYIKNYNSKIYNAVIKIRAEHKLVLTGTPIENSLADLWSQMNFVNPGLLGSFMFFKNKFITPIEKNYDEIQTDKLQKLISPFVLRRTKTEVLKDLPPISEQIILCEMTEGQERMYEAEKSKIRNKMLELIDRNEISKSSIYILQALNKLRQIANHPIMLKNSEINTSGKYDEITDKIQSLIAQNHKVLIFSSFVKHLNIFAEYFRENNLEFSLLTGKTTKREEEINCFQTNETNRLFLISIKAGGVGLNLTAADYVFILDPWWNPAVENQAVSRAHRIGQNKKVMVYKFITKNTVEEKIRKLQAKKQKLANTFISSKNFFSEYTQENILEMFK